MDKFDAIVVGGGVAGGTCALHLERLGVRTAVLEARAVLGHNIPCSGVFESTFSYWNSSVHAYPGELLSMPYERFRIMFAGQEFNGTSTRMSRQFFDEDLHLLLRGELELWLLERSNAKVYPGTRVRADAIEYNPKGTPRYTVRTPHGVLHSDYLIGAGATQDVVRKRFFDKKRDPADLILLLEAEIEGPLNDSRCISHIAYGGLHGLGWIYPKGEGGRLVNFGIAATRSSLKGGSINAFWSRYLEEAIASGFLKPEHAEVKPHGDGLYMAHSSGAVRANQDSAFIIGDAAGVLHRDFWNGITPAAESAKLAAEHVAGVSVYDRDQLSPYLFKWKHSGVPKVRPARDWLFSDALPSFSGRLSRHTRLSRGVARLRGMTDRS